MSIALVVDDSLTEKEVLSNCLRRGGINVETAGSADEALAKIISQKPDVIILDIVLPGRSGFELCRDLKAEAESNRPIPHRAMRVWAG